MVSEKVTKLQLQQQSMQNISLQKQQIESQLIELNSAMEELKKSENSYKILGNIMIAANKEELSKELQDKKEVVELRLKNFSKQEEQIKKNLEELQSEVMSEMK